MLVSQRESNQSSKGPEIWNNGLISFKVHNVNFRRPNHDASLCYNATGLEYGVSRKLARTLTNRCRLFNEETNQLNVSKL